MADKVKPLKIENPATGGTDTDMTPREMSPSADYAAVKGIAFENNDNSLLDLNGSGELQAKDSYFTTSTAIVDILPYYQSQHEDAETSTTSTTVWSTKVTLTTPALRLGTYKLSWSFKWRALNANREIDIRIRDGSTNLHTSIESYLRTAGYPSVGGFEVLSGISGVKTFTLEFKVFTTATTVYMSDAWLDIQRVKST